MSTTGSNGFTKSLNGIVAYDDGNGFSTDGSGDITCNTLTAAILNVATYIVTTLTATFATIAKFRFSTYNLTATDVLGTYNILRDTLTVNLGNNVTNALNLGRSANAVNIGDSSCPTINIGGAATDFLYLNAYSTRTQNLTCDTLTSSTYNITTFKTSNIVAPTTNGPVTLNNFIFNPTAITYTTPSQSLNLFINQTGNVSIGGSTSFIGLALNGGTARCSNLFLTGQDITGFNTNTAITIGSSHVGYVTIGNGVNANRIGSFEITGTDIKSTLVGNPTNICATTTGAVSIGNATNINKVGNITMTGNTVSSSTGTVAISPSTLQINPTNLQILGQSFRYVGRTTYTPTLVTGTCANLFGSYSVTGDTMFLRIWGNCLGAGSAGSGTYGFGIPTGYQIATNPFTTTPSLSSGYIVSAPYTTNNPGGTIVGSGMISNLGVDLAVTSVIPYNSTNVCIYTTFSKYQSSGAWNFTTSNIHFCYECTLPLV